MLGQEFMQLDISMEFMLFLDIKMINIFFDLALTAHLSLFELADSKLGTEHDVVPDSFSNLFFNVVSFDGN